MVATIDIKTKTGKYVSKDIEKLEPCYTISGNVKWYSCYRKQCDRFSKKKNISVLGIYSKSKVEDSLPSRSLQHGTVAERWNQPSVHL